MADPSGLSSRGRLLIDDPQMAPYFAVNQSRMGDVCDPVTNPDGYIPLCTAENKLVADLLLAKLAQVRNVPASALGYTDMLGSPAFRSRLASFLERHVVRRSIDPENVAVLAGAGTVLEQLFHVIADVGDAVLVPTPSYAGFWADLQTRDGLVIAPVPTTPDTGFRLTPAALDRALAAADRPVRALLYTSPDNPLGRVSPAGDIAMVIEWAEAVGVHLVMSEVYALSVYGDAEFVSAGSLRATLGDRLHLVWAFSKDLAMSGFRCGTLISENDDVLRAVRELAYWGAVSGDTQWALGCMVTDDAWIDEYVAEMRSRLATSYRAVTRVLDAAGIPHLPAAAGLFLLADLRRWLDAPTWEAERRLWERILTEVNVNVTPGSACHIVEPGFVRICFAAVPTDVAVTGVERLATVLGR